MRIIETSVRNGCLRIACAGPFGVGSEGNPSGHLLKRTLETALDAPDPGINEVVIDFTEVEYEWGDGPAWAVWPAFRRNLKVRYVARGTAGKSLAELFRVTGFAPTWDIQVDEAD